MDSSSHNEAGLIATGIDSMSTTTESDLQLANSTASRRSGQATWLVLMAILALGLVGSGFVLRPDRSVARAPLPIVAKVPSFELIERSDRAISDVDLRGVVWIADFIFTTCAGPCPELTLRMRSLQEALKARGSRVKLVSFTVDPEYDTPKVLRDYARRNHADDDLWWFLTGKDEAAIHKMIEKGFLQTVIPADQDGPIIHSNYFVLIDASGMIRGFYDGMDAKSKPRILQDVDALLVEAAEGSK